MTMTSLLLFLFLAWNGIQAEFEKGKKVLCDKVIMDTGVMTEILCRF